MAVDIKSLNHNQLNDLISKAQVRQDELRKEKVVKLREKVHALIKAEGYSFEDIFGSAAARPSAPPARSPRNIATRPIRRRPGPAAASVRTGSTMR